MKVIITGANSGIGRTVSELLNAKGIETLALNGRSSELWQLGERISPELQGDYLIHLAHDRSKTLDENIFAINQIIDSFSGRIIFLSSMSAHSKSLSVYGQSKFLTEQALLSVNAISIRSGLIFGNSANGFIAKLENILKRSLIIPLPFAGKSKVWCTYIEDLAEEIWNSLNSKSCGVVLGAHCEPLDLITLLKKLAIKHHIKRIFIKIPVNVTNISIRLISVFFPFSPLIDSIKSSSSEVSEKELVLLQTPTIVFRPFV